MPKTAIATPGKTEFVREFLKSHPQGNVKAVNEAWEAAGFEGTISKSVVDKARAQMGLTGNRRAKTKAATNMPRTPTATPGKTGFVKEFLIDHPQGNVKAVNEAWQAAGHEGTISPALVTQTRARLGLTGNLRGKASRTAAQAKAAPTGKRETTPTQRRGRKSSRTIALEGLEAEIDMVLFKVMAVGELPQIEATLRQARRLLYGEFNRG